MEERQRAALIITSVAVVVVVVVVVFLVFLVFLFVVIVDGLVEPRAKASAR